MIGIDEVGRGSWAGPLLVVAARIKSKLPLELKDSKKLTKKKREYFHNLIKDSCLLGEGWVSSSDVDRLGLTLATQLGVQRSLDALQAAYDEEIVLDGNYNYCSEKYTNVSCVINADDLYPIVSAASICAKVEQDNFMSQLDGVYKLYEFHRHNGYGTRLHSDQIKLYGPSDLHRLSFTPVKKLNNIFHESK